MLLLYSLLFYHIWYINTNITYAFSGGKVTGSYGDATARAHADTTWTAQDETDGLGTEGEVKEEGLKTKLIRNIVLVLPFLVGNFPFNNFFKGNIFRLKFLERFNQCFTPMFKLLGPPRDHIN